VISVPSIGQYQLLYTYLHERLRHRVVLRFSEIEDLLGFKLPEAASLDSAWWRIAETAGVSSAQSNAWALSGRTATVNLSARCVVFERTVSPRTYNSPKSRHTFIRRLSVRARGRRSIH
jgi:hypothetical protein